MSFMESKESVANQNQDSIKANEKKSLNGYNIELEESEPTFTQKALLGFTGAFGVGTIGTGTAFIAIGAIGMEVLGISAATTIALGAGILALGLVLAVLVAVKLINNYKQTTDTIKIKRDNNHNVVMAQRQGLEFNLPPVPTAQYSYHINPIQQSPIQQSETGEQCILLTETERKDLEAKGIAVRPLTPEETEKVEQDKREAAMTNRTTLGLIHNKNEALFS